MCPFCLITQSLAEQNFLSLLLCQDLNAKNVNVCRSDTNLSFDTIFCSNVINDNVLGLKISVRLSQRLSCVPSSGHYTRILFDSAVFISGLCLCLWLGAFLAHFQKRFLRCNCSKTVRYVYKGYCEVMLEELQHRNLEQFCNGAVLKTCTSKVMHGFTKISFFRDFWK